MSKTLTLYGHDQTRPGTDPPEWCGVVQWRTTRRQAEDDRNLNAGLDYKLAQHTGYLPMIRHRIIMRTVAIPEPSPMRKEPAHDPHPNPRRACGT